MKLGEAFIEVRPDTKGFRADLQRDVTADAGSIGRTLQQALVGGAFLAGAKKATDAASNLQQAVGGTSAVFGESARSVDAWSKQAAEAAGLSERAARELTSQIGGLLKGFGFAEDEAAGLSTQLAQLGADLAATFGGEPEEAVQALGAALRGETDPLERFGIALNQNLVNAKAVELGLAATTSAVDQHAKAQATLALITERSADAQGQFAREADTAAGQAAISAAKTENAAADLGENLLPIYTKLSETVGTVADVFGSLPEPVQTALIALGGIAALSGPIRGAGEALGGMVSIVRRSPAAFDRAAVGAFNLTGTLGKMAGVAAGPAAAALGIFAIAMFDAKQRADEMNHAAQELRDEVERTGDSLEDVALRKAVEDFTGDERTRDAMDKLGVSFKELREPLQGTRREYETWLHALQEEHPGDTRVEILANRVTEVRGALSQARDETDATGEAVADLGGKAVEAAPKVEGLTDKLDDNEQASKDAADSIDKFRAAVKKALEPLDFQGAVDARTKALQDLAAGIDDRRQAVEDAKQHLADLESSRSDAAVSDTRAIADAEERLAEARGRTADTDAERESRTKAIADAEKDLARAREDAGDGGASAREIADAQAALQEAIDATSTTLDGNSEAALRNRDELRNLVDDSVDVITSAREQGDSLDALKLIRENEVNSLRDQLAQMGFNKDEIEVYIDAIEAIPLTRATTLTLDTAKFQLRIKEAAESLQALAPSQQMSIDAAVIDRNLQHASALANRAGYAAGGFPFDGDFLVHADEVLRKRGADLEVISGPTPSPLDGGGSDPEVAMLLRLLHAELQQISGNTAGPTTGQRLRRVQTMAGAT